MNRRIGAAGLSLVKQFEGYEPKWYPDPAHGWKVPTIGYGHTDSAGEPKYASTKAIVLTEEQATEILRKDMQKYADAVSKAVKAPLTDNQFDALVSWCYNVGPGAVAKSTLVRKLNAGDYASVPSELAKWNKAGGKTLKGLTRRRAAEAALFVREEKPAPAKDLPRQDAGARAGQTHSSDPSSDYPDDRGGWLAALVKILNAIFGAK